MGAKREIRILIVEDHPDHAAVMRKRLEASNRAYRVEVARTGQDGLEILKKRRFAIILLDYSLPDGDGLQWLDRLKKIDPDVPVVFVTAEESLTVAVEAMKRGAADYVVKHCDYVVVLPLTVKDVLDRQASHREHIRLQTTLARTQREVKFLKKQLATQYRLENLVTDSALMRSVLARVQKAIDSEAPILLTGETGTGKELVARMIHFNGPRRKALFAPLNCATLPAGLLESELFGYVRGAFTGATRDKAGLLDEAQGGTLFLDEIGELPLSLQPKLLRVIQERTFRPVGATQEKSLHVRFIAATNVDLSEAIRAGRFRKDLYFRLNGIPIELPPLRKRREDIGPLVTRFLEDIAEREGREPLAMDASGLALLSKHPWPGNVRELQHLLVLAAAMVKEGRIAAEHLRPLLRKPRSNETAEERERILAALERNRWNRARVAAELGISRVSLWRRMRELEIELE